MLDELKQAVCEANLALVAEGLVMRTWGNVSGIDRPSGRVVIKPSGVPYDQMRPEHMTVVDLGTGDTVSGDLRPSSDTPTHLALYRSLPTIAAVAHTHSTFATAWAQAMREIPPLGTTHADYFHGPVPCTRMLSSEEIATDYEANTGLVIAERLGEMDPLHFPGVLVGGHGPFTWGVSPSGAVDAAGVLENLARLASETLRINPAPPTFPRELLDKHFLRKHGRDAYYGQD